MTETTIRALQQAMASRAISAEELVQEYLARIAAHNGGDAGVNAVLEVNPHALGIAAALDRERQLHGPRGPLHGVPILLKDNIDTADALHTSAGSLALENSYAAADAFLARRLREAGAVILGKANMTEWANFISDHMPNGYSSRGGQVRNPYGPGRHDSGGSSSGPGAGVAANLAAAAVGTETSGSILSPASQNSVVGVKPTVGLVSRSGVVPISYSQDTAGPMARTVEDAATLLGAMTGVDEADPVTATSIGHALPDYRGQLDRGGLRGRRIGIARDGFWDNLRPGFADVLERAITDIQALGATIVDGVALQGGRRPWTNQVLVHEFKSAIDRYLAGVAPHLPVHSLRDVIAFNAERPTRMLRYGQPLFTAAEATSGRLTEALYLHSRLHDLRSSRREGIDRALAEHRLDALLFPANYGASVAACAGYPSVCVPGGYTPDGEPVGVTFTASAYSEALLIRLAHAYEQATRRRVAPKD